MNTYSTYEESRGQICNSIFKSALQILFSRAKILEFLMITNLTFLNFSYQTYFVPTKLMTVFFTFAVGKPLQSLINVVVSVANEEKKKSKKVWFLFWIFLVLQLENKGDVIIIIYTTMSKGIILIAILVSIFGKVKLRVYSVHS